ncbi:MAG: hypothetical protein AB1705_21015 [Verrucomicrobiota bacterium]
MNTCRTNTSSKRGMFHALHTTNSFLAAAFIVALAAGCGSKPAASTTAAPAPPAPTPVVALQAAVADMPPPPPGSPAPAAPASSAANTQAGDPSSPFNAPDQGANDKVMAQMNEALRKFYAQYERAPYDIDELVSEKFLETAPTAPAGKEYFYDSVGLRFKLINKRAE